MALTLNYTITHPNALKPERHNENSVAYNLFATENITVPPFEVKEIDTGIVFEMQGSFYGQIENVPENKHFKLLGGIVDVGYRSSIKVFLLNLTNREQFIVNQDAIARIIFLPILLPTLIYKEDEEEILPEEKKEKFKTYVKFTKTSPSAIKPCRFEEGSVGYDLHALSDVYIQPMKTAEVETGIILEIEGPFYAQIRNKSGFSTKKKLNILNGIIDSNYKCPISVEFENLSNEVQYIFEEDQIAQIVFLPVVLPILKYKNEIDGNTIRGEIGFQSGNIKEIC